MHRRFHQPFTREIKMNIFTNIVVPFVCVLIGGLFVLFGEWRAHKRRAKEEDRKIRMIKLEQLVFEVDRIFTNCHALNSAFMKMNEKTILDELNSDLLFRIQVLLTLYFPEFMEDISEIMKILQKNEDFIRSTIKDILVNNNPTKHECQTASGYVKSIGKATNSLSKKLAEEATRLHNMK